LTDLTIAIARVRRGQRGGQFRGKGTRSVH
jgi:hypothetical protein